MATRSRIAIQLSNGKYISSYHHYDGYPASLGYNLIKNYADDDKTIEAIELGDASHWGKDIHPTTEEHSFDNREDGISVYYNRDRGESKSGPFEFASLEELLEGYNMAGEEFLYVRQNSQWGMMSRNDGMPFIENAEEEIKSQRERMIQRMKDYNL